MNTINQLRWPTLVRLCHAANVTRAHRSSNTSRDEALLEIRRQLDPASSELLNKRSQWIKFVRYYSINISVKFLIVRIKHMETVERSIE